MIQKYFSILVILTSITVVSCRQDNELNTAKEETTFSKKEVMEVGSISRPDSIQNGMDPNDPPKNGTHYRGDSINIIVEITDPPKNGTHYKFQDSLNVGGEVVTDRPKNGIHYKGK